MNRVVHLPIALANDLFTLLTEAEIVFGDCASRMDPTGKFCTVCTTVEQLQEAIWEAEDREAGGQQ
jgi:hypothetical protein